ncbi:MAG: sporulation protein YqfD [Oscillospiraceae bacterium]|nr:sporulation protein YqfD [Oscillospiraceae bacterium]
MFIIRIIRYLTGFVRFSAEGGFPERFINLAAKKGLPLWDVKSIGDKLYGFTTAAGYKNIRKPARNSGMRVRIINKSGFPFFKRRYRKRTGFVVGGALAVIFLMYLSTLLWNIQIDGNETLTDDEVISALEELNVKNGARMSKIDTHNVEVELENLLPSLSWVTVNLSGSTAYIELRERKARPEIIDTKKPSDIIAKTDGEILKIESYSGTGIMSAGSAVLKGDLLISGKVEMLAGPEFVRSRGCVLARTAHVVSASQSKGDGLYALERIRYRYGISILSIEMPFAPLGHKKNCDIYFKSSFMLSFADAAVPIGLTRESFTVVSDGRTEISAEKAALAALFRYYRNEQAELAGADIRERALKISDTGKTIVAAGSCVCEEDIGFERFFEVEGGL